MAVAAGTGAYYVIRGIDRIARSMGLRPIELRWRDAVLVMLTLASLGFIAAFMTA